MRAVKLYVKQSVLNRKDGTILALKNLSGMVNVKLGNQKNPRFVLLYGIRFAVKMERLTVMNVLLN